MCKIVYLTSKRFDKSSSHFKELLRAELESRKIEVVTDYTFDIFNSFKSHKTYGISIGIDFFKDNGSGRGVTLNKNCSNLSRAFAYNLSTELDLCAPSIRWRDINFVKSDDSEWYKFFNKISSETKAIFYLCTKTDYHEYSVYLSKVDKIVKSFADEIVRCLRSDYNYLEYQKRVDLTKRKKLIYSRNEHGMDKE